MPNMWDRLRPSALKDGGGAAPLSQKKLEQWQNSRATSNPQTKSGYSYHISAGLPPPRPPREPRVEEQHQTSTTPTAPPQAAPPRRQLSHRDPPSAPFARRPASSIYSQASSAAAAAAVQQLRADVDPDPNEISPPSSPDQRHDEGYVSPLEEMDSQVTAPGPRSNIPQMRRERRKNSDAAMHALRESRSRDRIRQRTEGNDRDPAMGDARGPGQPKSHQGQEPANIFGIRLRQVRPGNPGATKSSDPATAAPPPSRPEWQGASRTGRTTLVAPVKENPGAAPLTVPPRSSKRPSRGPDGVLPPVSLPEPETLSPTPALPAPKNSSRAGDGNTNKGAPNTRPREVVSPGHPVAAPALPAGPRVVSPQGYPSPPLSDDNHAPPKPSSRQQLSSSTAHSPSPQTPSSTLIPPTEKAIRRKPTSEADHQSRPSMSSSVYSDQRDIHPAERTPGSYPDDWNQAPMRFSASTDNDSSRPSGDSRAPPVPAAPRQSSEASKQMVPPNAQSMLERKRPAVPGYEDASHRAPPNEPIRITMDSPYYVTSPTPMQSRSQGSHPVPRGNYSTLSVASMASTDKSLPLAPPEETARDRVSQLNAQLKSLGNRRININQAIRQMTELMPTDNVLASNAVIAKREAEKRKVETLRNELADVQREEYDLGLKLHRAYKRMDRNADYEPTTLWVRRVTG